MQLQNYPFISCRWTQTEKEENDFCLEDITYTDQDGNTHCVEKDSDETVEVQCIADGEGVGVLVLTISLSCPSFYCLQSIFLIPLVTSPWTARKWITLVVVLWMLVAGACLDDVSPVMRGGRKECSKTEDCTKMDKCASGHCYCSESNRAGNEPSRSLKFYNLFDCIYTLFQTYIH